MTEQSQPITLDMTRKKANIILDASKIDLFETCPRRYEIRHIRNKTLPIVQKSRALDLGSLAHEGLAVYYKLLGEGKPFKERMEAAVLTIRTLAADPDKSVAPPDEANVLINSVMESCEYWRGEDENCLEIVAIEEPFAYVLFEDEYIRIVLTGKIDLLVNYNGIGANAASYKNLPWDHKTFSRDSPILRKSNQFVNYCNAVESSYLWINRIGLQKTLKPVEKYKRIPLSYDPYYFQEWKRNLTVMLLQEYLPCIAEGNWPEKPTSCNKFNRLCEYYDVCDKSTRESKEFEIQRNYIDAEEWDVTKKLEEVQK